MFKNKKCRTIFCGLGFACVFLCFLTVITLIYYPKRADQAENNQMCKFYSEPENSIDVLFLGSCNMYSSFNPVLFYEEHGVTSYVMGCPDQEMVTSYHYLLDAIKRQDLKTVVVESLFFNCPPTAKREYYNRLALDYMPMSLNKLALIDKTVELEVEYMQSINPSSPGKVLTYAGYLFPLLRYHGRDDMSPNDFSLLKSNEQYSYTKGAVQAFSYTTNDNNYYASISNGSVVKDISREYFLKIKQVCEENGINLLVIKSPNNYRWNEEATAAVRDFTKEIGVTFLDFQQEQYGFEEYDYANNTGRLNAYGMKKLTGILGDYLVENYGLTPTPLSDENTAKWAACMDYVYSTAAKNAFVLTAGEIAQISNEQNGICVRWNACTDSETYEIWRCEGKAGDYTQIAVADGVSYVDESVEPGKGYSYYIVPETGAKAGIESQTKYYVFVEAPKNVTAANVGGMVRLRWDEVEGAQKYYIYRKYYTSTQHQYWGSTEKTRYTNDTVDNGSLYSYRLRAIIKEDDVTYYSDSVTVRAIPMETPVINKVSYKNDNITISWNTLNDSNNPDNVEIWRKAEGADAFELYEVLKDGQTSYTDKNTEKGIEYFYKLVATETADGHTERSEESNTVGVVARG